MQTPCGQPNAKAVAHQHLQPRAAAVGKHIGVVRLRGAEDFYHSGQQPVHATTHIHRLHREPDLINANHRRYLSTMMSVFSCSATQSLSLALPILGGGSLGGWSEGSGCDGLIPYALIETVKNLSYSNRIILSIRGWPLY